MYCPYCLSHASPSSSPGLRRGYKLRDANVRQRFVNAAVAAAAAAPAPTVVDLFVVVVLIVVAQRQEDLTVAAVRPSNDAVMTQ